MNTESHSGDDALAEGQTLKMSPDQMQALLAAAGQAVTRELRGWQPPSVEVLQGMLPQYEITEFIARGGMGAVYKGVQRALDRTVAIKILPPDIVEDGEANYAQRFKQEARAMAKFKHPGIVTVYDAGETPEGLLYFVMEFIEGTDVAHLVAAHGQLPPEQAIRITTAVCDALAYAHARGVVHRDIKPSNIMIDADGQVKVADFGLAKITTHEPGGITKSSVTMGTPDFVAPEAMLAGALIDQRADIYAVGVMLYQMLTGHIPRGRFSPISAVVPQSDPKLDAIVDKAMQTDREKRYSSAVELKADVESVTPASAREGSAGTPAPSNPTGGAAAKKDEAPKRVRAPLIVAAVVVLGAGAFLLQKPGTTGSNQPPSAPVPAWATLKPIPAFLEGRAVKLWDAPGKIPSKSNYQWEDNALRIDGDSLRAEVNLTSVIFRASVRMNPDAVDARLLLRLREGTGPDRGHYYVSVNNKRVELAHTNNRKLRQFGHWLLNKPYQPDEWLRVEVRMIGETIIVAADGAVLGIVRDALALEPGKIALYGKSKAYFRDVSYIQLDGVPKEELAALAGLPATASVASRGLSSATKEAPFTNTLGMKFVPVPGTDVLFCIHETRRQDYAAFAAEAPGADISWKQATHGAANTPAGHGDDHPVVSVSWEDARAFCAWLGKREGRSYRLPTDREWSWAVGIGAQESTDRDPIGLSQKVEGMHAWGTDWPPPARVANLADKAFLNCDPKGTVIPDYEDGFTTTAPVMSFPPNGLGIHDLGGNVWEWCQDKARNQGETRAARGGAFDTWKQPSLLSSYRVENLPGYRHQLWGFRVVLEKP
ncbi:MAG: SUMF1/EgtB/PvdO family nonheme iron enzyme [Verrucomicrobiaceae bacterium]|nr:SUMF1/EgtB/PvdO family nonheme iron enzyme [Verrucomicrobiaceae bacterium]